MGLGVRLLPRIEKSFLSLGTQLSSVPIPGRLCVPIDERLKCVLNRRFSKWYVTKDPVCFGHVVSSISDRVKIQPFSGPKLSCGTTHLQTFTRALSSLSDQDLRRAIESVTEKFMEARELMEDAKSALGTVYFSEEMKDAQEAVLETLSEYKILLEKANEDQEQQVRRTIGLKMEELKAQLNNIEDILKESD